MYLYHFFLCSRPPPFTIYNARFQQLHNLSYLVSATGDSNLRQPQYITIWENWVKLQAGKLKRNEWWCQKLSPKDAFGIPEHPLSIEAPIVHLGRCWAYVLELRNDSRPLSAGRMGHPDCQQAILYFQVTENGEHFRTTLVGSCININWI